MSSIYGSGWCQSCDYTTVLEQYESKVVSLSTKEDWDKTISVYCPECGHKHTSTPREYFKSVNHEERLLASIKGIEAIEEMSHLYMNIWYLTLNLKLAETMIRKSVVHGGNLNCYLINKYSEIAMRCDELLDDYITDKNNWIKVDYANPEGSLIEIKPTKSNPNKIREYDEIVIYEFLASGGIDLYDYPYSL